MEKQIIVFDTARNFEILIENCIRRVLEEKTEKEKVSSSKESLNRIIDIEQTADFLNLAKATIYGLVHRNKIPHFKQGKKLRFKKSDLMAWIEKGRRKTVDEIDAEADKYLQKR